MTPCSLIHPNLRFKGNFYIRLQGIAVCPTVDPILRDKNPTYLIPYSFTNNKKVSKNLRLGLTSSFPTNKPYTLLSCFLNATFPTRHTSPFAYHERVQFTRPVICGVTSQKSVHCRPACFVRYGAHKL